jgi:tRNA G18 (ribose-2'-O)-methylase SpoU
VCFDPMVDTEWVENLDDPRVAYYRNVKDAELRRQRGLFMAEGRFVVELLLEHGRFDADSLFVTPTNHEVLRPTSERQGVQIPLNVAKQDVFDQVVGFRLHRGCLAAGRVGQGAGPQDLIAGLPDGRSTLVVLEGLTNTENVGAIFRNAMAFGADGVLLCPRSCDPLYRKAIRVSMGGTLRVPFTRSEIWPEPLQALRVAGYQVLALDPGEGTIDLPELISSSALTDRVAWLVGTEGEGVSDEALACCDLRVRIPMSEGVDSINVATASAIGLQALFSRRACVGR